MHHRGSLDGLQCTASPQIQSVSAADLWLELVHRHQFHHTHPLNAQTRRVSGQRRAVSVQVGDPSTPASPSSSLITKQSSSFRAMKPLF